MPCKICHKSREGEPVYVHPDDDGIDGMHPMCAIEHVATLNEMLNGAGEDNDDLRAELSLRQSIIEDIRKALGSDMLTLDTDLARDVTDLRAQLAEARWVARILSSQVIRDHCVPGCELPMGPRESEALATVEKWGK